LHARLIKPTNFDPNKKYPVIVYLYGGPHAQMVTNSWLAAANVYMAAWAADGFVVFTIDNRGSYNRGVAFEQAPYRNMGTPEMEDQLVGVKYLKSLPYVDGTRLGIHGWSYGGFMTTTMMSRAPGTFKVGIAGAPVIDWAMYEIMYTERYMDTPKENPQGYETANLVNHAQNVKGKFMLIHGTSDDVVVWQNTQAFLKKAIESGVQLDYFIYPGHGHGVGGKDRIHLMKKMTNYFKDNL
jgi:dipeptidyl-peptidase-4